MEGQKIMLTLPHEDHRALKILSVHLNVSMQDLIREAVHKEIGNIWKKKPSLYDAVLSTEPAIGRK